MLAVLPSAKQVENRKSYISKRKTWEVVDHASFLAWASLRMCVTKEQLTFAETDRGKNGMIIIDAFMIKRGSDEVPISFGVVVTSPELLRNMVKSIRDQGKHLVVATDGTYKFHFGGWTVVDCGTETVAWENHHFRHKFVPWAYMFVRSECTEAYTKMFDALRRCASDFFDTELSVGFGSLDHSEAIASAFVLTWPRVKLLLCWPHLVRQAKKQAVKLSDSNLFASLIKPFVDLLRLARTHEQFVCMSVIVTNYWIYEGEATYAHWFRSVYLSQRRERWHINGAGVPGIIPSQQGIETHHSAIKKVCVPSSRASTAGVLDTILPRIITYGGDNLCPERVTQFCEGPIPPEMITKASRLVKSENHRRINKGRGRSRRLIAVVFNTSDYICDGQGIDLLACKVDEHRAKRFNESLLGHIPHGITAVELKYEVLSLHRVSLRGKIPAAPFQLKPIWPVHDISTIRALLQCTCASHVRSGWVCAHVLATLSLLHLLDLRAALCRVPTRLPPGRPRSRRPALVSEEEDDKFFSLKQLEERFVRSSGYPMHWKVLEEFLVSADGHSPRKVMRVGVVDGITMADDGYWRWIVIFKECSKMYMARELAVVVRRAYKAGVAVAGPRVNLAEVYSQ